VVGPAGDVDAGSDGGGELIDRDGGGGDGAVERILVLFADDLGNAVFDRLPPFLLAQLGASGVERLEAAVAVFDG
jgi:hypothetical protein